MKTSGSTESRFFRWGMLAVLVPALALSAGCVRLEDDGEGRRLARLSEEYTRAAIVNPPPETPLSLQAAVEYALLHGLSVREAELEYAVQVEERDARYLAMLPSLNVRGGFDSRSRYDASVSKTIGTGRRGSNYTTSDDKDKVTADISLVWSVLDFGLSYVRAFQQEENTRIAREKLHRLRQQVAMETAIAYHRAAAAAETVRACASLDAAIQVQLDVIDREAELRNISRLEQSRRSLPFLIGLRRLEEMRGDELSSRINLARTIGCPRPEDIVLEPPADEPGAPAAYRNIDALVAFALTHRPEMSQDDSRVRVSEAEAKAALLQLAPNVNLSAGYNYDGNSYQLYHHWLSAGLSVAWNMLSLPARYKEYKTAKQRIELERQRERITAASIVMQVHLAALDCDLAERRLAGVSRIEATHGDILRGVEQNVKDGKSHQADLLLERLRHIVELQNLHRTRADCLSAEVRLFAALGLEPNEPTPADLLAAANAESAP